MGNSNIGSLGQSFDLILNNFCSFEVFDFIHSLKELVDSGKCKVISLLGRQIQTSLVRGINSSLVCKGDVLCSGQGVDHILNSLGTLAVSDYYLGSSQLVKSLVCNKILLVVSKVIISLSCSLNSSLVVQGNNIRQIVNLICNSLCSLEIGNSYLGSNQLVNSISCNKSLLVVCKVSISLSCSLNSSLVVQGNISRQSVDLSDNRVSRSLIGSSLFSRLEGCLSVSELAQRISVNLGFFIVGECIISISRSLNLLLVVYGNRSRQSVD